MKDELVSRKTAILAKEKGFVPHMDSHPFYYYRDEPWNIEEEEIKNSNDIFVSDYIDRDEIEYSAPTQTALSRWLREVHSIHLLLEESYNVETEQISYYPVLFPFKDKFKEVNGNSRFYLGDVWKNTYEEAIELGLQEALKLIK